MSPRAMETPSVQLAERDSAETPVADPSSEIDREVTETLDALVAVHNEIASIRALLARRPSQEGSVARAIDRDPETQALEQDLTSRLGLKVSIVFDGKGGSIKLNYRSLDQLDGIVTLLSRA